MPDILHRIGIQTASIDQIYEVLSTNKGLAGWWTRNTTGEPDRLGGIIEFRFGAGGFDMKVIDLQPAARVQWQVAVGPDDWVGTTISFELKQEGDFVIVLFKHQNWREATESMHHCSTKWAIFLMSLKSLLETGEGKPDPIDVKIDNWN